MKRVVVWSAAALMVWAAASFVWSQQQDSPTSNETAAQTQAHPDDRADRPPVRPPGERRFDPRADGMRGRMEWRRGEMRPEGMPGPGGEAVSDEEWNEIVAFMKKHSPKRMDRLDDIVDDERRENVRSMFAARYRALQEIKGRDAELYEIRLQRQGIEDEVFALGWEMTHGERSNELRGELRKQMRLLVKNRIAEREIRLKHAEERLEQERQRLKEDQSEDRLEAAVDAGMREIIQGANWPRAPRREWRSGEAASDVNATQSADDER